MPGTYELILIFGIVALLLAQKIKSVGSDIGSWIRDFRKAVKEDQDDNDGKNKSDRIIDIEDNNRKDVLEMIDIGFWEPTLSKLVALIILGLSEAS